MAQSKEASEVVLKMQRPEEVESWLHSGAATTAVVYGKLWDAFYAWLQENGAHRLQGLSPMELVELQNEINWDRKALKSKKKVIVKEILRYVNTPDHAHWRTGYKRKINSAIRSFFNHHIEPGLPSLDNGEKNKLKGSSKSEKNLKIEDARLIIGDSNLMYKAVWSCMLASGMGPGEIIEFSDRGIDSLREKLADPIGQGETELIEVYLSSRKNNLENEFYTYIGGSALTALKIWVKHREEMEERFNALGRKGFPDSVFVNNTYKPLNEKAAGFYWIHKLKLLKLWKSKGRRYDRSNKNLNQMRTLFKTRSRDSRVDQDLVKYFMGHKVGKHDYDQYMKERDNRVEVYLKILNWVDVEKISIEAQGTRTRQLEKELEETKRRLESMQDIVKGVEGYKDELEFIRKFMNPVLNEETGFTASDERRLIERMRANMAERDPGPDLSDEEWEKYGGKPRKS